MKIKMYQIDAFTSRVFGGNPAAVCVLGEWLDDDTLQAIASENNLSETAYIIPRDGFYDLRWFTPVAEIDLAGHPTLASAYAIFEMLEPGRREVRFETRSGSLHVIKEDELLAMDFPSQPGKPCQASEDIEKGLGVEPEEVLLARYHMVVLDSEEAVLGVRPDFRRLENLPSMGVIVTAPGRKVDFVSRFFAPKMGIPEDPVTGSAHCTLIPYWSKRLGKIRLTARQVSERGGALFCEDQGERVRIAGQAVIYLEGDIWFP